MMTDIKYITITLEEYRNLRYNEAELRMLDAGGVDNWEWYSESLYPSEHYSNGENIDTIKEEIDKELADL
jgi:hypothetical protein